LNYCHDVTSVDLAEPSAPAVPAAPRRAFAWRWVAASVAVLLLASGALWTVPGLRAHWAGSAATPSLPATFATYSHFTSSVSGDPGGRAIAVYEYGDPDSGSTWQTVVAGANRDSYRQLPGRGDDRSAEPYLLSPDGSHILFFHPSQGTDEFSLQDLTTGQESTRHSVPWVSNVGGALQMLAWSPDGRYVAYGVPAPPPGTGRADDSIVDGHVIAQLAILDVEHDTTVRYPAIEPVFGASFAPDGALAVQLDRTMWLGTLDGHQTGGFHLPDGADLVSTVPWSPDGTRIPVATGESTYGFVDPRLAQPAAPTVLSGVTLLGWRGPSTVVALAQDASSGENQIVEVSLVDGRRTVLSRFPNPDWCGLFTTCAVYQIQLASGLLSSATVRGSDPDRGLSLPLFRAGLVVAGTLLVVGLGLWLDRRRRFRPTRHLPGSLP
jgi:hypothetical protein